MASAPSSPDHPTEPRPITHPLQIPAFRAFLVLRLCTILGQTGMSIIIAWQAYNIARLTMAPAHAAAQLGLIGLIQFVVLFFATPFAGLASDNYKRTRIGMVTLTMLLGCAAVLAFSSYEGWISLPLIFSIAAVLGLARAFQGPALSSLAPNIVPKEMLPRAIAFSSMFWQAGGIVGPAIAGYAYALEIILCLYYQRRPVPGLGACAGHGRRRAASPAQKGRHPIRQVIDGLSYVRTNRLVFGAITLDLFAVLLAGTTALLPVYARDILHIGSAGLGHLAAAPGIGAGITALVFSFRPLRHNVGLKMLLSVGVFGIATIVFGLTAFMPVGIAMPVALLAMAAWGSADMFSVFVRQSLIQLHTPDEMRGRVSSVSMMTISASTPRKEIPLKSTKVAAKTTI